MAVMSLPKRYRKRLRTINAAERFNQKIRRRERVIWIFPNEDPAIRLIGAVLVEIDESRSSGACLFDMAEYRGWKSEVEKHRKKGSDADSQINVA